MSAPDQPGDASASSRRAGYIWIGALGVVALIPAGLLLESLDPRYVGLGGGAAFSPMFYPRIVLFVWLGLSVLAFLAALLNRGPQFVTQSKMLRPLAMAGLAVVMAIGFQLIGFILSATVGTLLAALAMGNRQPMPLVATALLTPLAIWIVFVQLLGLSLPTGSLF